MTPVALKYRPDLDGLRAVAVALVIGDHFHVLGNGGVVGVTLFFVLSGYLITRILVDERDRTGRIDLRRFYVRRIRRLVPALALVLVFVVAVMAIRGQASTGLGYAASALLYVGNWFKALGVADLGMLGHTWSLSVEEQFYVAWPLVLLFIRDRRVLLVALVAFVVVAFLRRPAESADWAYFATDSRGDALAIGCVLGLLPALRAPWWSVPIAWTLLLGLAAYPQLAVVPLTQVALLCGVAVIAGGRPLAWRPLVRIGQVSYAIYLWQQPFRDLFDPAGQPWPLAVALTGFAVVAVVAVALLSEIFERRFRAPRSSTPQPATRALGPAGAASTP